LVVCGSLLVARGGSRNDRAVRIDCKPVCALPAMTFLDLLLWLLLGDLLLGVVGLGELISHGLLVKPTNGRTVVLNGPS
jgi:hypothetical protein